MNCVDKPSARIRIDKTPPPEPKEQKKFIELTGDSGNEVFIKASAVNGVVQNGRYSKVFVNGDSVPYEVKEKAEEVIKLIAGVN